MEIELKYSITDANTAYKVLENDSILNMVLEDSREEITLDARYYDTADFDLQKRKIALRIRNENGNFVETVKWSGTAKNGVHRRNEVNVILEENRFPEVVSVEGFANCGIGNQLSEVALTKDLEEFMRVSVLRKVLRVNTGRSILEFAFDIGNVITSKGSSPISELEVELIEGHEEDLIKMGNMLQNKFCLKPEKKSKFVRGLILLGRINIQEEEE
ncbi:MAG: CYTH domain-containing protein [Anaerovoracaceae bacterium]